MEGAGVLLKAIVLLILRSSRWVSRASSLRLPLLIDTALDGEGVESESVSGVTDGDGCDSDSSGLVSGIDEVFMVVDGSSCELCAFSMVWTGSKSKGKRALVTMDNGRKPRLLRTVSGVVGVLIFWLNSPSLLVELLEHSPALLLRADRGERLSLLVSWLNGWGEKSRCLKEDAVEGARASVVGVNGEGTSGVVFPAVIGLDLLTLANLTSRS